MRKELQQSREGYLGPKEEEVGGRSGLTRAEGPSPFLLSETQNRDVFSHICYCFNENMTCEDTWLENTPTRSDFPFPTRGWGARTRKAKTVTYSKQSKICSGHFEGPVFSPNFSAFGINTLPPSFPELTLLLRPRNGFCSPTPSLASSFGSGTVSPKNRLISWG